MLFRSYINVCVSMANGVTPAQPVTERIEKRNGKQVIVAYQAGKEVSVRPHFRPTFKQVGSTVAPEFSAKREELELEAKERTRVELLKEGKTVVEETPGGFLVEEKAKVATEEIKPTKKIEIVSTARGVIPEEEYLKKEVPKEVPKGRIITGAEVEYGQRVYVEAAKKKIGRAHV